MPYIVYNKTTGKEFGTKYSTQTDMKDAILETFGSPDSIPDALAWKYVSTPTESEKLGEQFEQSGWEQLPLPEQTIKDTRSSVPFKMTDKGAVPADYNTYEFTGYDNKKHKFSGTNYQDAYGQAIASGIVTPPSADTRRRMLSAAGEDMKYVDGEDRKYIADLAPYQTELKLTRDNPSFTDIGRAALKDLLSLGGRGYTRDVGKTSEEYTDEGRTWPSIYTSPLTGATIISAGIAGNVAPSLATLYGGPGVAGIETATKAAPWIASGLEGLAGVGAGAALDENYGETSAAVDIAVSMASPVLKPVIGKITKSAAISRIKSLFKKSGEVLDDESAEIAYNIIAKEGSYGSPSQVQKNALERLASQQSPEDYSNIISEKLDFADALDENNPDLAQFKTSFKAYLKDLYGNGDKNVVQYFVDDLYNQGAIDIDKYKFYMGRLDEFAKDQKDIYTRYMDDKMPRDVYNKRLIDLYMKNEDIPGFSEHFQDIFGSENKMLSQIDPKGFEKAKNELLAAKDGMTDEEFEVAQENLLDKWFAGKEMSDVDFARTVNEAKLAGAINKGVLKGGSKFDGTRPIESGWPIAKEAARSPSAIRTAGKVAGESTRFAPTLRRMYDKQNKKDENGNLIYAPKGNVTYDWLWEEAEKVKSRAKKLKNVYGE